MTKKTGKGQEEEKKGKGVKNRQQRAEVEIGSEIPSEEQFLPQAPCRI